MNNENISISDLRCRKRPILITILTLLLMLSVITSIHGFLTPTRFVIYPDGIFSLWGVISMFYVILMLIASVGYWLMKPWGVYIFAVYIVLGFVQEYTIGNPVVLDRAVGQFGVSEFVINIGAAIYGAVYIIPGYFYIIRNKKNDIFL